MSCFRKNFNSFYPVEFEYTIRDKGLTALLPPGTLLASLLGKIQSRPLFQGQRWGCMRLSLRRLCGSDHPQGSWKGHCDGGDLGGFYCSEEPWIQDPWHRGAVEGHRRKSQGAANQPANKTTNNGTTLQFCWRPLAWSQQALNLCWVWRGWRLLAGDGPGEICLALCGLVFSIL